MKNLLLGIAVTGPLLTGGYAFAGDVRQDTKVIGLYIQSVKQTAEEFKLHRDLIARAALRNTNILEEKASRSEQAVLNEIAIWQIIGDKDRISLYEGLRSSSDQVLERRRDLESKQAEHKKLLDTAKSATDFRVDKLSEAATTLAKLAEQKSTTDQAKFYVDFIKQVRKDIEENSQKDAEVVSKNVEQSLTQKNDAP